MKTKSKKKEKIESQVSRQRLILKKHYCVDEENKLMTIDFKYDAANEIFRHNVNPTQVPMIEHELIDNVTYFFDRIPDDYRLDLNYQIKDLQEYTFDEISEAYFDALELDHCLAYKRSKKFGFNAAIVTIIGCCFLIIYTICDAFECFASMNGQIMGYIIDCVAGAFILEGLSILFLYKDEEMENNQKLMDKLHSVSFIDKDNNKVISCSQEQITKKWKFDSKKERFGRYCFLAAGTVLLVLGAVTILGFLISLKNTSLSGLQPEVFAFVISHLITASVNILAGIACLSKYNEHGPLLKAIIPLTIILFIANIVDAIYVFAVCSKLGENVGGTIFTAILSLIVTLFITFEAIRLRDKKKKNKK